MNAKTPLWLLTALVLSLILPPSLTGHPLETDGAYLSSGCVYSARLAGRHFDESGVRVCEQQAVRVSVTYGVR